MITLMRSDSIPIMAPTPNAKTVRAVRNSMRGSRAGRAGSTQRNSWTPAKEADAVLATTNAAIKATAP